MERSKMNLILNEKTYARYKAFGMSDVEICYLLDIKTNQLSVFKRDMDYELFDYYLNENLYIGYVERFHDRMKRKYDDKNYQFKKERDKQ